VTSPIRVIATFGLALTFGVACYDHLTPIEPGRTGPARVAFSVGPETMSQMPLSAVPNTSLPLPNYTYSTWAVFTVDGNIDVSSLPGSRTNYAGPVYAEGVWSQINDCAVWVHGNWPAAGSYGTYAAAGLCGGQTAHWVDTVLVNGAGIALRGPGIFEFDNVCGPGVPGSDCHGYSGYQTISVNPFAVTLNKPTSSIRALNYNAVSYFNVTFTASRTPATFTVHGSGNGHPMTITS
jgi:hypothetical protein